LSAAGWILRIAEEDGEVDDDFPREILLFLDDNYKTNLANM
jgi:hypothetical protein